MERDLSTLRIASNTAVIAAFAINELDAVSRNRFRREFIAVARNGSPVLVVEPIAKRVTPWWDEWSKNWKAAGGRDDEWRFRVTLPEAARADGQSGRSGPSGTHGPLALAAVL